MTEEKKKLVGKLDMEEVEDPILAILEHIVDTYNLIYHTRGISEGLPLRLGHLVEDNFIDMDGKQGVFHSLTNYEISMLLHILTVYTESNIIGDEEMIEMEEEEDNEAGWVPEGIGIDMDVEED